MLIQRNGRFILGKHFMLIQKNGKLILRKHFMPIQKNGRFILKHFMLIQRNGKLILKKHFMLIQRNERLFLRKHIMLIQRNRRLFLRKHIMLIHKNGKHIMWNDHLALMHRLYFAKWENTITAIYTVSERRAYRCTRFLYALKPPKPDQKQAYVKKMQNNWCKARWREMS